MRRRALAEGITVAIATLDRPDGLARCLEAVLSGEVVPGEVVVVDQSRDEATLERVRALLDDGATTQGWDRDRLVYVRQSDRGLSRSRNAAIARSSRDVVAFTDDDCVPDRRWVATIARALAGPGAPDAVTGRVLPLGPDVPGMYAVSTRASTIRVDHRGRTLPWNVGSGGNTAVRRAWLERVERFDVSLGAGSPGRSAEDVDLLYRLLRSGATIRYEPDAIIFHERQSGERRLASRPSYGYGMGAFCARWLRRRDPYALWIMTRWSLQRGAILARACARGRWRRVHEEVLLLRGAGAGFTRYLRPGSEHHD